MKLRMTALPIALLLMAFSCQGQTSTHNATLTWGASTTTGATYSVLRGTVPGGSKTSIKSGLTALTFVDTPLAANSQFCYVVVASSPGLSDSVPSNEVCGKSGQDTVGAPGTLGVVFQ